ncbi:MAG: hypothetical protein ACREBA_10755, partial [Nitrosotalea sp.]
MKTLYLSILILFVIFGTTAESYGQMVKNDLGDGNVFNIKANDRGLPGDIIEINGNLVTTDPIKIILNDPNGIIRNSVTTFSDRNGDFTSELKIPTNATAGTWKIIGNSGIYYRELNFTVIGNSATDTCYAGSLCQNGSQQSVQNETSACCYLHGVNSTISPAITVATNHAKYATGDEIIITGNISNPDNKTRPIIKIFAPNHEFLFYKFFPYSLNKNYTWMISTVDFWSFDQSGNYTVSAYYGDSYAETHFYLNATLLQYLYSSSPLQQFRIGNSAQDVHCHTGFSLIIRSEDFTPACAHKITATTLILRGWAIGFAPIEYFVSKIDMTGLQQNYEIGKPIDVTVNYAGYWMDSFVPDVKIFDTNGTQVWYNCPECSS